MAGKRIKLFYDDVAGEGEIEIATVDRIHELIASSPLMAMDVIRDWQDALSELYEIAVEDFEATIVADAAQ